MNVPVDEALLKVGITNGDDKLHGLGTRLFTDLAPALDVIPVEQNPGLNTGKGDERCGSFKW
jgi:hypothetical protein